MKLDNLSLPVLSTEHGKRYIRIVTADNPIDGYTFTTRHRSVFCFIDKTNGDILKAASWKSPAKHPRGNVFSEDGGASAVSAYGAVYLR